VAGRSPETRDVQAFFLLWNAVRGDARRLWFALRHPEAPGWLKLGVALLDLYVLWPGIPVIGLIDDMIVVPLAIRSLLKRLPPVIAAYSEARAAL
jgi:uncharacterized membrane protein YkvA (DUF1232 family)